MYPGTGKLTAPMSESGSSRSSDSLSSILSEEISALRRQAEIDLEVTMREHRFELDQILARQKAILRSLTFLSLLILLVAAAAFFWLRHEDASILEGRNREAEKEVAALRRKNEEAQALIDSFRELERAWKRRLLEAAGARAPDEAPASSDPLPPNSIPD